MSGKKIVAKNFSLFITQKCTMNCKLCVAAAPYIENPIHTPLEMVRKEIEKFFEVWDFSERVELVGGEPLMHPQILEIAKEVFKYSDKFDNMRITTNATILPSDDLCEFISSCDKFVDFCVDDYGEYSKNLEQLTRKLEKYDIPYRIDVYHGEEQRFGGWVDFGDFTLINDDDIANVRWLACPNRTANCIRVNQGKCFLCSYAVSLYYVKKILPSDGSYLDLFDDTMTVQEKKELVSKFYSFTIEACRYCKGYDSESERFPGPPEQVIRKLKK